MDRTTARRFIKLALDAVSDELKNKVTFQSYVVEQAGSARIGDGELTLKIKIIDPKVKASNLTRRAKQLPGGSDMLGKRFNFPTPGGSRRMYEVTDINPRRPKYPITAKSLKSGKLFKFALATVTRQLKKS